MIGQLMNKGAIRDTLSSFDTDIASVHNAGLRYILGKTNSISCHGEAGELSIPIQSRAQ